MMLKMVMKKMMMKMRTTTLMKMQCQPEAQAAVAAAQLQQQKQKQQQAAAAAAASIVVYTVKKIVQLDLDYRATYDGQKSAKQQQTETNRKKTLEGLSADDDDLFALRSGGALC